MTDKQGQSFALKPAKGLRDAGDGSNSQAFALRSATLPWEEELLVGSRGKAPRLLRLSITLERCTLTGIIPTLSLRGARAEAISCLTSVPRLVRQEIASSLRASQ